MFCTNCGQQNLDAAQFCTNCGKPMANAMTATKPVQAVPSGKRFEVSKLFLILLYVLLGLIIIGAVVVGFSGGGASTVDGATSVGGLVKTIINWLLGLVFGVSVLGLMGGVIAGIILLVKARDNQADASYYKRNAMWCFLGPMMIMVDIILGYVIINVVSNLVSAPK